MSTASAFADATHSDRGFASVFVTAPDGLRLHIRSYGSSVASALPVVCLPALARTAADFHPLAAALAADPAKPRLVLALDYRGHGQSTFAMPLQRGKVLGYDWHWRRRILLNGSTSWSG